MLSVERETGDVLNPWQITQASYDASGKQQTATDPENSVTDFDYDAALRLMRATDAEGRITERDYDAVGRLFQLKRVLGVQTIVVQEHAYTANGRPLSVIDAEGNQTGYTYDDHDRPFRTVFADTSYEQRGYDANGNTTSLRTRAGDTIAFTFDELNRRDGKTLPNLTAIATDYDDVGRTLAVTSSAEAGSYDYLYDGAGRLTQVTRPDLKTVGYGYDPASNRTRLDYPDASFVTYDYDELGRMTGVRDAGTTLLASYAYDPLSRLITTTTDNGAQTTHTYELDNDLSQVAQSCGVGSVDFDYLYNFVNQRRDTDVSDAAYLWVPDQAASNDYVANELNQYIIRAGGAVPAITGLSRSRALARPAQMPGKCEGFRVLDPMSGSGQGEPWLAVHAVSSEPVSTFSVELPVSSAFSCVFGRPGPGFIELL